MWFKNLHLFNLEDLEIFTEVETLPLQEYAFTACAATAPQSQGWVNPVNQADQDCLSFMAEGFLLLCLRIEKKILPAKVLKECVLDAIKKIELREKRKVYKREKESLKDEMYQTLLIKAFSTSTYIYGCIDSINKVLLVDTSNRNTAELFTNYLRKTCGSLKLQLPQAEHTSSKLTQWLLNQEVPADFSVNETCILQNPRQEKSLVRVSQQDLSTDPVQAFILNEHFYVRELEMTWLNHITFTFSDDFSFRKLRFSDEVHSSAKDIYNDDKTQQFASDFVVMAKTLRDFIKRIYEIFTHLEKESLASRERGSLLTKASN